MTILARLTRSMLPAIAIAMATFNSPAAATSPAMWHMSDKDSEVWLFGTIHLLPPGMNWRTKKFNTALAAADTVYLEADVTTRDITQFPLLLRQIGLNSNFVTLPSILGPADSQRLMNVAETLGYRPRILNKVRPWVAWLTISRLHIMAHGYDYNSGADIVISNSARAAGKRLAYFETIEQQFKIFASFHASMEKEMLISAIDLVEKNGDPVRDLVKKWTRGESIPLDNTEGQVSDEDFKVYNELLLVRRNVNWVEQISGVMAGSGKTFIAVGAAHMPGKHGLITLLRKKGFKIKRL